jgi:ribonuclease HI
MQRIVFTDGGCSNNNQPEIVKRHMRAVVLAEWDGRILADIQQRGGSNNIAEFMAVEQALLWAKLYGCTQLEIRTDSRNNLAWTFGRVGRGINDREAVMAIRRNIDSIREHVELKMVWLPRRLNAAGLYLERTPETPPVHQSHPYAGVWDNFPDCRNARCAIRYAS